MLSESGISSSAIIETSRSQTLPALLSANETMTGLATAPLGPDRDECFYRRPDNRLKHR